MMKKAVPDDITAQTDLLVDRKTAKKAIRRIIKEWKTRLGMTHWTIFVNFSRAGSMAECYSEPEYFKGYLNFYMHRVMKEVQTNYDLEELVVHELCHCLAWDLVDMTERLIENTEDETGELEKQVSLKEEILVSSMSHGLVMAKYGLTEVPENVRLKGWEERSTTKRV